MNEIQSKRHYLQMEPGAEIHETHLLAKCFSALEKNAKESLKEKDLQKRVIQFKIRHSFSIWRKNKNLRSEMHEMNSEADLFHHYNTLLYFMQSWKMRQLEQFSNEKKLVKAKKFRKNFLMRSALHALSSNVQYKTDLKARIDNACDWFCKNALKYCWKKWSEKIALKEYLSCLDAKANEFRYFVDVKTSWISWVKKMIRKRQISVKIELTVACYEKNHLKKHFFALRVEGLY